MKNIFIVSVLGFICISLFFSDFANSQIEQGWRCAWISGKNVKHTLQAAKELNFKAVVISYNKHASDIIKQAKSLGLDVYVWLAPQFPAGEKTKYQQVMSERENILLKKEIALNRKKKLYLAGYQGGGEPLKGTKEVLKDSIPCFHRQEVVIATKRTVKKILDELPEITGIALDMFGYQNYHCCYCKASLKAFEQYQKSHSNVDKKLAWKNFCLESLVNVQNEICQYARTIRPDIKITCHIWPVYLPEPLYGNKLDIDYCGQTAAWFFKPYWSDEKIIKYTRIITNDAQKYYKRQHGIPFVGYFNRKYNKQGTKPPKRLAHEIDLIFSNESAKSLAIYNFSELANTAEAFYALKQIFDKYGIIGNKHLKNSTSADK